MKRLVCFKIIEKIHSLLRLFPCKSTGFAIKRIWQLQTLFLKQLLLCFPFFTSSSFGGILSEHHYAPELDTGITYTLKIVIRYPVEQKPSK